ncbi:Cation_ATPase_N domain-containing protein [Psidium guajava]|nr:Cation_ATPase_N domain-containing protein [Psidium guajava]
MENTCCQPETPSFQYYPPPAPTWLDPSSASSSSQMPTWVKVAIGIAVLLFCCILYIFLKWREKEITASSSARPPEKEATKTPQPQALTVKAPGPCFSAGPMRPSTCPSCTYNGGLYHGKFRCPSCSYRKEVGVHVQYPE